MDLIWKGAVRLTIFHLPISYFWYSWRLGWYKIRKLQPEKETLWDSSGRRCQKGMTGSEEVSIIFAVICPVINLLTTKLPERSGNPHGGWGLAEAKPGARAEDAQVGRGEAAWATRLCLGGSWSPFAMSIPCNLKCSTWWWGSILWTHSPLHLWGFPDDSDGKEATCNARDLGSIPGLGRSPEGGHSNPLQSSCLENPHGQRSLVSTYSLRGRKESTRMSN